MICRFATSHPREQAAEDPLTELERLSRRCPRALSSWVSVSPGSQMVFRPEEVDRRSERIEGFAPVVTALAEPDHHALGIPSDPLWRRGKPQRFAAVMAGRRNVDGFSDHRRDAERVGRATGVPLASDGESYSKRRWRSRERIGDVDLTGADTDQVLKMSRTRGCSRAVRRAACRSRELRAFNSSAVMIMRSATIGLLSHLR